LETSVIDINTGKARLNYSVGQLIRHNKLGYRGVIVRCDHEYCGTEEWYDAVAGSHPPKNQPWYEVLVDGSDSVTYVAERNLEEDAHVYAVEHPLVDHFFSRFVQGRYFRV
jgi:heat shock protein HspQ